jgi:hypothetical protein
LGKVLEFVLVIPLGPPSKGEDLISLRIKILFQVGIYFLPIILIDPRTIPPLREDKGG